MRPKSSTLTAHELELMKIVWRHEAGVTVRDVYEEVRAHRPVAYTTVMTSLKTLEQKGHLKATQQDRAHLYRPARPKAQVIKEMVRDFVDRVFNGSGQPLVVHMLEDEQISESELREITRMLGEKAMTTRMVLSNIAAFALQVTVLVAAGAALARAFRIDEPRAMFAYWRTLLFACLVLPLCQPWNVVIPPALTSAAVVAPAAAAVAAATVAPVAPPPAAWPIADLALMALAAGIAGRTLWLAIGAFGLRRLRRHLSPLEPLPETVRQAQERLGAQAGMYVSDRVSSPITFGLLRPVVVFPASVSTMPAHVQEAIAYHELLHVQRRDWLYEILEEIVRCVLWFHPAIWWLIGRIRLTREQVVDQAAIRLTDSRERYVESLLAVAIARSPAAFMPASPFLRRHLLKKRVARILQETTMTTRRLIASLTASVVALALTATFAVRSFPLEAQGRAAADDGQPIQLVSGGQHLMHGDRPEYPERALKQSIEGDVVVDLTLDNHGEVSDARVLSGPDELRKATLEAVLQWHYAPAAIRLTVTQATLRFKLPVKTVESMRTVADHDGEGTLRAWAFKTPEPTEQQLKEFAKADASLTEAQHQEWKTRHDEMEIVADRLEVVRHKVPLEVTLVNDSEGPGARHGVFTYKMITDNAATSLEDLEGAPSIVDVRTERLSDAIAREVLTQAGLAVGQAVTREGGKRLQEVAQSMDEHFRVEFEKVKGGVAVMIIAR